jgi:hypothetical protein
MEGVTTALVAFLFVCIVYPQLVQNRPQYYAAWALVLLIIGLSTLEQLVSNAGLHAFLVVMTGVFQIGGILLVILSCGGVTIRGLADDIGKTIDVVRRGGEKETIIIPLTGEQPKSRD